MFGGATDVFLMLDVSQSMLIGATQADIDTMHNSTAMNNCAFACHTGDAGDTYNVAQTLGVRLRLDVLKSSVSQLLQTLAAQDSAHQMRVAVYTFNSQFTNLVPLSSDLQGAAAAVASIPAPLAPAATGLNHTGDTLMDPALRQMAQVITANEADPNSAGRNQLVVMVTDGVNEPVTLPSGDLINDPVRIDQSACNAVKLTNTNLAIMNLDYFSIPSAPPQPPTQPLDSTYDWMLTGAPNAPYPIGNTLSTPTDPYMAHRISDMQLCATSSAYYAGSEGGDDLEPSLQGLLQATTKTRSRLIK
jgi:hypothetical protein